MQYLNHDKTSKRIFFITILFIVILFLFLFSIVLCVFPIQLHSNESHTNESWYSKFFVFWPESLVKQELSERKKLKRYPKAEIERRLSKQINAMKILNSPLYDIWLDNNVETTTYNSNSSPDSGSFFWPVFNNTNNLNISNKRQSEFVVFPEFRHIKITKGFYLGSGEHIKSNIPISNTKRFFVFEILPLATGRIKVALGQYVWTKSLFEFDLHKAKKFIIPINDSFAQNYKILNVSSSFYLLNANIITPTLNGRETIYLPNQSEIWTQNTTTSQEDNLDPLLESSNPSQLTERVTTLAKGYNVIILSVDGLPNDPLKNKNRLQKLMPSLYQLSNQSVHIKPIIDSTRTVDAHKFDIPLFYKKYGYKTAIFSNAEQLSFEENLTSFKEFEKISRSWLTNHDVLLHQASNAKNNNKIDGLNAVFKQPIDSKMSGIQKKDLVMMSAYLEKMSRLFNMTPKLAFDDNIIISEKDYSQNLIRAFQKWSLEHKQTRFYLNIELPAKNLSKLSSLQDLIGILTKTPTLKTKNIREFLQMKVLDRELTYIFDALRAHHITNRTIIVTLFKNRELPEKSSAMVFIPGIKSKVDQKEMQISLNDLMLYEMSVVGIPVENEVNFQKTFTNLESKQTFLLDFLPETGQKQYNTYSMVIDPSQANCTPFFWKTSNSTIFDVKSNLPFYEISNKNIIKFFPCSFGKKILTIEWKQEEKTKEDTVKPVGQSRSTSHIYGYFLPVDEQTLSIDLYCGKNLMNRKIFPLNFHHTPQQMNTLFFVDKKEFDQIQDFAIKSFEAMQVDQKLTQNTRVAFFISKTNE